MLEDKFATSFTMHGIPDTMSKVSNHNKLMLQLDKMKAICATSNKYNPKSHRFTTTQERGNKPCPKKGIKHVTSGIKMIHTRVQH